MNERKQLCIDVWCNKKDEWDLVLYKWVWNHFKNTDICIRIHSGKVLNQKGKGKVKLEYNIVGQFQPDEISKTLYKKCSRSYKDKCVIVDESGTKKEESAWSLVTDEMNSTSYSFLIQENLFPLKKNVEALKKIEGIEEINIIFVLYMRKRCLDEFCFSLEYLQCINTLLVDAVAFDLSIF